MASSPTIVAFFCMPEPGHFQVLRTVIARAVAEGMAAYVFTHRSFQRETERVGGRFVDLFARRPLDDADDASTPFPCRYVSFAGCFADSVSAEVRAAHASLVIYESFSVIAPVVAKRLGLPYVNVCAGHNVSPARFVAELENDPRVKISDACLCAVDRLRSEFDSDATPFSYVTSLSPLLNLYCEPSQFLSDDERDVFRPVVFWGSIPDERYRSEITPEAHDFGMDQDTLHVFVSFGTIIWRYFQAQAVAALQTLSEWLSTQDQTRAVISLGGADLDARTIDALNRRHVRTVAFIDQWAILKQADVFVTHHGINSTHESIFLEVPMISCPFFWDQPALARKCQEFGLAIPLTASAGVNIVEEDVRSAFARLEATRDSLRAALAEARPWEVQAIQQRGEIVQQLESLARDSEGRRH